MKKNLLFPILLALVVFFTACGGGKSDKTAEEAKIDSAETKSENKETKEEPRKLAEPTELGDYEMKCEEKAEVSKLIFEGVNIDTKNITKTYAFNFGGTTQLVYLANFEPDMKMLESGNIDSKKLQVNQFLIKLQFTRRNNKDSKDLITTIAPYNRVIMSNPDETSENNVMAAVFTNGKEYGRKFLGKGMLSGVTKKAVCGKAEMQGENDDKYQLNCIFNAVNQYK
jgi:hypothetical protein